MCIRDRSVVKAVPVTNFTATRKQIDKLCADVEVQSGGKVYWFRLDEKGELVGGISKFLQDRKEAVIAALGLKPNTFVGLTAGKKLAAQKTAGVLIKMLPALAPEPVSYTHLNRICSAARPHEALSGRRSEGPHHPLGQKGLDHDGAQKGKAGI